jgi:AcrR family transcriptional regulator
MAKRASSRSTSTGHAAAASGSAPADLRQHILDVASDLFYREGVRAVGVDLIVERARVAKTSLYRYFPTKDELVAAYLQREDAEFWHAWDEVIRAHGPSRSAQIAALMDWIGQRVARAGYRGCPQLNVTAEFADAQHPARRLAAAHKLEQRRRLNVLCRELDCREPGRVASQLAVLIDGAFTSGNLLLGKGASKALQGAAAALLAAA